MKKLLNGLCLILPALFMVVALVALSGCSGEKAASTSSTSAAAVPGNAVNIMTDAFSPQALSCKVGTTVTWTNKGSPQRIVASDSYLFNSYPLDVGKTFTYTFDKPGIYPYHCSETSAVTAVTLFRGKVVVEP
jgi:plastocyanin